METLNYWLLPPLVGEVQDHQAVILLEPKDKELNLRYEYKIDPDQLVENEFLPNIGLPTRIVINFPYNGNYKLNWYQGNTKIYTHDIVISNNPSKLIFASCDMLEAETTAKHSMWNKMLSEIEPDEKTCLVHLGDQAYMDNVFIKGVKYLRKHGRGDSTDEHIIRSFVQRYYDTWNPHHEILSSVANYNIWDDHEIKNNITLDDTTLSPDEAYVRELAVKAYLICQESQHLEQLHVITPYCWYKRMGNSGEILMIAIERTSRVIAISEILEAVNTLTEEFAANRVILCFSCAPIPAPVGVLDRLYKSKFWDNEAVVELYEGLFEWMGNNYVREVLVAGGDLHFGSHSTMNKGDRSIPIIISSPITNNPTTDRWLASRDMLHSHQKIGDMFYNVLSTEAKRCYATVELDPFPMKVSMKYCKKKLPKSTTNYLRTLISFV